MTERDDDAPAEPRVENGKRRRRWPYVSGGYHFFTLCRPGDQQAANFLGTVPDDPDALPPAIDLELAGNCSARPSRQWVEQEVGVFIDEVESATGQPVVFYIGDDFAGEYEFRSDLDRPIWHRRILIHPEFDDWWIWQFSGRSSVDGIEGDADLDVMRGAAPEAHLTVNGNSRRRVRIGGSVP